MTNPLEPLCEYAVMELDVALGPDLCGAVIEGSAVLGFKGIRGGESPYNLTCRVAVTPVMDLLGYGPAI